MSEQIGILLHLVTMLRWACLVQMLLFYTSSVVALPLEAPSPPITASNSANLLHSAVDALEKKNSVKSSANTKPEWSELTAVQKIALKPLYGNWNFLGNTSKRKWIALSINFQSMAPAEQLKLHERMNEWVALSQQERTQARLNFTQSQQLPQSHKAATWKAYQALSQEEKSRLSRLEKDKKSVTPVALKNNQQTKSTTVPVTIQSVKLSSPLISSNLMLDRRTLLLRMPAHEN